MCIRDSHILAYCAITSRQSPAQDSPFIDNRDRGTIELQLRHQVGILPRQLMNNLAQGFTLELINQYYQQLSLIHIFVQQSH